MGVKDEPADVPVGSDPVEGFAVDLKTYFDEGEVQPQPTPEQEALAVNDYNRMMGGDVERDFPPIGDGIDDFIKRNNL